MFLEWQMELLLSICARSCVSGRVVTPNAEHFVVKLNQNTINNEMNTPFQC